MGKTNTGLVDYVKSKIGTDYVYGMKMAVMTKPKYDELKKLYGSLVWDSDAKKIGKMCCDCSGLISAYTGIIRGSAQYKAAAKEVFPISTVSTAPAGALVWKDGHIGVYVGTENGVPMYIAADGSAAGTRKGKLPGVFTHWFLCGDVEYAAEKAAVGNAVTLSAMKVSINGGVPVTIPSILRDGLNYPNLRELCGVLGVAVDWDGQTVRLKTR